MINLRKLINYIIILVASVLLTTIYIYSRSNLTVISKQESDSVLQNPKYSEILKDEVLLGEFQASENYLGQISVRFYNFDRINKDDVDFKLSDQSGNIIYEHVYKTDQFMPNDLFPFGFPVVEGSRGRTYRFEIKSINGRPEDAVTLSRQEPLVTTSYQYPKKLLIKNPKLASEFLIKKISYIKFDRNFFYSVIEYLISITLFLLLIWLFIEQLFKFKKIKKSIGASFLTLGLILIFVSAILYYLKFASLSESITILGYFIVVFGVILLLIEAKLNLRKDL